MKEVNNYCFINLFIWTSIFIVGISALLDNPLEKDLFKEGAIIIHDIILPIAGVSSIPFIICWGIKTYKYIINSNE